VRNDLFVFHAVLAHDGISYPTDGLGYYKTTISGFVTTKHLQLTLQSRQASEHEKGEANA
jgi:hypothetical protein